MGHWNSQMTRWLSPILAIPVLIIALGNAQPCCCWWMSFLPTATNEEAQGVEGGDSCCHGGGSHADVEWEGHPDQQNGNRELTSAQSKCNCKCPAISSAETPTSYPTGIAFKNLHKDWTRFNFPCMRVLPKILSLNGSLYCSPQSKTLRSVPIHLLNCVILT